MNDDVQTVVDNTGQQGSSPVNAGSMDVDVTAPANEPAGTPQGQVTMDLGQVYPRAGIDPKQAASQPVAPQAKQDVNQFGKQAPNANPPAKMDNPAVKKASWIHDVAETLAGGPRYKYDINPNTGEMSKTPVPVSGKHIAMAIALEAIGGAATGLAYGKGAGNMGKGAAAAFAQGEQRVQQQQQEAQKQASDQYARQAAIAKTNMEMLRNEQISSQADSELQQKEVDLYAQEYKEAVESGHVKQDGITPDQVRQMLANHDLNITQDMLIPYQVAESRAPDGTQLRTTHGAPKWEKRYALVDPLAKIGMPDDTLEQAYDNKLTGFVNPNTGERLPLAPTIAMRLHQISGLNEKLRSYLLTDEAIKGNATGQEHALHSDTMPTAPTTTTAPAVPASLALKDKPLEDIADNAASQSGIPPALMRAVSLQEGSGKINVKDSKPNSKGEYAVGPFQVTPKTAAEYTNPATGKPYTEAEIRDPKTNAEVSGKILANLLKSSGGDVQKALLGYFGGTGKEADSNGMTGDRYVKEVMERLPSGAINAKGQIQDQSVSTPLAPTIPAPNIPSVREAIGKGLVTASDIDTLNNKLFGAATLLDGKMNVKDVVAMAEKQKVDPSTVGRLMSWLGPRIDWASNQNEERQLQMKETASVQKQADVNKQKELEDDARDKEASKMLVPPSGFKYNPDTLSMGIDAARDYLARQGVQIPDNFADLYGMAQNDADTEGLTPRTYKGVTGVLGMNRTMGRSYIKQYLDQNWKQQDFKAKQQFVDSLNPSDPKVGQVLYNSGVAAQHLALAEQLFNNLNNRQSPIWNKVANEWLGNDILGQEAPAVYNTVATQLANEVSKVTTGVSGVTDTSVEHVARNLKNSLSPEQAAGNLNALINLMKPRLSGIATVAKGWHAVDDYKRKIDPETIKVFASHGIDVPGYGHLFYSDKTGQVWESQSGDLKKDGKLVAE